jgi:uncharacterized membrane protein
MSKTPEMVVLAGGAIALVLWAGWAYSPLTLALVVASVVQAGACYWACHVLYGRRAANIFLGIGAAFGWFAEQMGSSRGWFFGNYTYTEVLGPRLGDVPLVIPCMWFGICFIGLVIASLILWRQPAPPAGRGWKTLALAAFMTALIVTAFDLGADPWFVYVIQAWIMEEKDGYWFGETVRGFEGWMIVSFAIVSVFLATQRPESAGPATAQARRAAAVPIALYAFMMLFQIAFTQPVALKVIAFYAMGIPLLAAAVGWWQWARGPEGAG